MKEFDNKPSLDPDVDAAVDSLLDPAVIMRLLEAGEPIEPGADARARMRAELLKRSRLHAPLQHPASGAKRTIPAAFITVRPTESDWQKIGPGLEKRTLLKLGNGESFLLRLHPGAVVPAHDHDADEECVVIDGEITIDGVRMPLGTMHLAPRGLRHSPISSTSGALLYVKSGSFRTTL